MPYVDKQEQKHHLLSIQYVAFNHLLELLSLGFAACGISVAGEIDDIEFAVVYAEMVYQESLAGFCDVFARPRDLVSMFISEDFPTFDLPINAYSGTLESGHCETFALLISYFAFLSP